MQQIAEWLDELGLSEHAERFVANKIDVAVLPLLTDEDLKESAFRSGIGGRFWRRSTKVIAWYNPRRSLSQRQPLNQSVLTRQSGAI